MEMIRYIQYKDNSKELLFKGAKQKNQDIKKFVWIIENNEFIYILKNTTLNNVMRIIDQKLNFN